MDTVIVTGATGFIGSNLTKRLVREGYDVAIITREESDLTNIEDVLDKIENFSFDKDIESLINFLKRKRPKVIFHLASLCLGEHSFNDIENLIDSNIKFGSFILEAMKEAKIKNIINTGTAWQHYNNEKYNAVSLYAATKESFLKIMEYYVDSYSMRAITLELFDSYGEKDKRKKLINLLIDAGSLNKELNMTEGNQLIDLTHIEDIVEAFLVAYKHLIDNINFKEMKSYGVCTGRRVNLKELVGIFEKITGYKMKINWGIKKYKDKEVMNPWDNYEKLPNWNSKISLEKGLERFGK